MAAAQQIPVFEVGADMKKGAPELHLRLVSERMTASELIRARVVEEVKRYNEGQKAGFCDFERSVVESRLNTERGRIDPEQQTRHAIRGFHSNRFLLFVDDRQIESADEELILTPDSEILFVRLVPLAGG